MTDRVFATVGDWALASDGVQWILLRRWKDGKWRAVSFVRSTRDILARCMREKGADDVTAARLLSGLPDTFDQWKASQSRPQRLQPTEMACDEHGPNASTGLGGRNIDSAREVTANAAG